MIFIIAQYRRSPVPLNMGKLSLSGVETHATHLQPRRAEAGSMVSLTPKVLALFKSF